MSEKIHYYHVVCQKCKTKVLFLDPKFCTHCGAELSVEAIAAAPTMTETEWKVYQCHQRSW